MKLYLLGISHFDPLGRDRLISALRALQKRHNEPPYFVAVEYKSQHFDRLRRQRSLLPNELSKQDPRLSAEELAIYEHCIAYEGDAYQDLFPHSKTVWLDDSRNADAFELEELERRATRLRETYLGITGNQLAGCLEKLSHHFRSQQDPQIDDLIRERRFAEVVKSELNEKKEWAIVIVGRAHTNSMAQGSMAYLLVRDGIQFVVCDLVSL